MDVPVYRGLTASKIAEILTAEGLLLHPLPFRILARFSGLDRKLKAGLYRLSPRMSLWQVLKTLSEGRVRLLALRIPEGYTAHQIFLEADRLGVAAYAELASLAHDPDFLRRLPVPLEKTVEGFLFPETYHVPHQADPKALLRLMVRQFVAVIGEDYVKKAEAKGLSLMQAVILASLVQKEAADDEEMPLIAGVLHNRLRAGMKLEINATLNYVLEEPKAWLTEEEMNRKSPYNTYLRKGLPPTPICNPGRRALLAAVEPADVPYFFYVAPEKGAPHLFAVTYAEHRENVRRVRRAYRSP